MTSHDFDDSITGAIIRGTLRQDLQDDVPLTEEEEHEEHLHRTMSSYEVELSRHVEEVKEIEAEIEAKDQWHLKSVATILAELEANADSGLSSESASERLRVHGPNELEKEKTLSMFILYLLQFANIIILLLVAASIASIALGEWIEGVAILFIVNLNAMIAVYTERSANSALAALAQMSQPLCVVIRDGKQQEVASVELVPGDVVLLKSGDVVPADLRLVKSSDLKVNEMLLTGEPEDVSKDFQFMDDGTSKKLTSPNMVFSSTSVAAGTGLGVVCLTGMDTRVGNIARLLHSSDDKKEKKSCIPSGGVKKTPLQKALHKLGVYMGMGALLVCTLVFVVGLIRGHSDPDHPDRATWLSMIMVSISLAISSVPEGLPLCVTVCQAIGTSDMVKKNALVRRLPAVETLGSASVICTDKTGTLTLGKMCAQKLWAGGNEYEITGKGFVPDGEFLLNGKNVMEDGQRDKLVQGILQLCLLCSDCVLQKDEDEEDEDKSKWVCIGNSSEAPLVVAAAKAGLWRDDVAELNERVDEIPFSSSRKMMVTTVKTDSNGGCGTLPLGSGATHVACLKGAPNYILKKCTSRLDADGNIAPMTEADSEQIMASVDDLSSQALRVLAVAYRPLEGQVDPSLSTDVRFKAINENLVFAGLIASIDPERDGVKNAVAECRGAGVRVVMITGDYRLTAIAIAKNIGLLQGNTQHTAVDCEVLRPYGNEYLPDPDIDAITAGALVFARAKPEDKQEIVKSLQRQGLVTAMTGDGVNDAPSLKESDIGVAMGIAGTEVAKGASDLILTDDNFCSIVAAVEKGRVIYKNIQSFVCFLLSTNVGEVIILFLSILIGLPTPLQPLAILFLNLLSDGAPALALSVEPGTPDIMEDMPRPRKQPIIHGRMWLYIAGHSIGLTIAALVSFCLGLWWSTGYVLQDNIVAETNCGVFNGPASWRLAYPVQYSPCVGYRLLGQQNETLPGGLYNGTLAPPLPSVADGNTDICSWIFDLKLNHYVWMCKGCYRHTSHDTNEWDYDECAKVGVQRARTMAFITMTLSEVFRAYTVRSFRNPFFVGFFRNRAMQRAAFVSTSLTVALTLIPGVRGIFGFNLIGWWMWLTALALAFYTVLHDECIKSFFRNRDRENKNWSDVREGFKELLLEMRSLRQEINVMESKMHIRAMDPTPHRRHDNLPANTVNPTAAAHEHPAAPAVVPLRKRTPSSSTANLHKSKGKSTENIELESRDGGMRQNQRWTQVSSNATHSMV